MTLPLSAKPVPSESVKECVFSIPCARTVDGHDSAASAATRTKPTRVNMGSYREQAGRKQPAVAKPGVRDVSGERDSPGATRASHRVAARNFTICR